MTEPDAREPDLLVADPELHASLRAIREALPGAGSADQVLALVAARLPRRFALWRASIRVLLSGPEDLTELVAVWSAGHTNLVPGLRIPLRSTSLAGVLTTGRPEIVP